MDIKRIAAFSGIGFFVLIGLGFVKVGLQELAKIRSRKKLLLRLKGTVLTVRKSREYRAGSGGRPGETYVRFSPYIAFTTPAGEQLRFDSETGASIRVRKRFGGTTIEPESPWRDGQSVEVFYDPGGVIKPCLAERFSLYGLGCGFLAAGIVVMLMGAIMLAVLATKK